MATTDAVVEHGGESSEIAVRRESGVAPARTARDIIAHVRLIEEVKNAVMKEGTHYGTIPGCGDKQTLLKPGAEKLLMTFHLCSEHEVAMTDLGGGHREYLVKTPIRTPLGLLLAVGVGCCSTMESKYRWRASARKCPKCGKESIIKGAEEYGGGWLCWKKKDGCGAKFRDGDATIEGQAAGKVENPDLADTYNTVLKMAKKRSLVDGALAATGSSDFFAQDLEDMERKEATAEAKEAAQAAPSEAIPATGASRQRSPYERLVSLIADAQGPPAMAFAKGEIKHAMDAREIDQEEAEALKAIFNEKREKMGPVPGDGRSAEPTAQGSATAAGGKTPADVPLAGEARPTNTPGPALVSKSLVAGLEKALHELGVSSLQLLDSVAKRFKVPAPKTLAALTEEQAEWAYQTLTGVSL